jgi:hypothetical protein
MPVEMRTPPTGLDPEAVYVDLLLLRDPEGSSRRATEAGLWRSPAVDGFVSHTNPSLTLEYLSRQGVNTAHRGKLTLAPGAMRGDGQLPLLPKIAWRWTRQWDRSLNRQSCF